MLEEPQNQAEGSLASGKAIHVRVPERRLSEQRIPIAIRAHALLHVLHREFMLNLDVAGDEDPLAVLMESAEDEGVSCQSHGPAATDRREAARFQLEGSDAEHRGGIESEDGLVRHATIAFWIPARQSAEEDAIGGEALSFRFYLRHDRPRRYPAYR